MVDAHVHLFPPEIVADRARFSALDPHFATLYANPRARLATAEAALASMDRYGIAGAFALGFGWSDPALCRAHNDYLIDVQRRYPGRFAGFAALQPRAGPASLAELTKARDGFAKALGDAAKPAII
ncbi:MAG: amidohydrolase family protein, partial [Chloroflexota bacterium]